MNIDRPTIKIAGSTILAALAVILQILPPIFVSPWSMRIDLVAIPWILCWIIFGLKPALLSILISAPMIGFVGPLAGGWVGAIMKSVASIWMFVIPGIIAWKVGGAKKLLENKRLFVVASIVAIFARIGVTVIFNYYFALPIFFEMTPNDIINFYESVNIFGLVGLGSYIAAVAFWNTIQAIVDLISGLAIGQTILQRFPGFTSKSKDE